MTTQTPTHPRPVRAPFPFDRQATTPLAAPEHTITDSLSLLDHRSRSRAILSGLAPQGQYLALDDGEETRLIALDSTITHIGRGIGSDLRLEQQHVSRSHAIVVRQGRYARLLDNRSANGTYVNDRQIRASTITDGDVIRLGPVTMRYVVVR
jgi:pSer/pThr/pTyr-binding forkhead associated (FHA) protein